jgi:hypothetical protein
MSTDQATVILHLAGIKGRVRPHPFHIVSGSQIFV